MGAEGQLGIKHLIKVCGGPPPEKGDRVRAATAAAPALAYRCFLHQWERHFLLPVQRSRWLWSFHCSLGSGGIDDRKRDRNLFCKEHGRNIRKRNRGSSPTMDRSS